MNRTSSGSRAISTLRPIRLGLRERAVGPEPEDGVGQDLVEARQEIQRLLLQSL